MHDGDRGLFGPSGRQLAKIAALLLAIALTPLAAGHTPDSQQPAAYESDTSQSQTPAPDRRITPSAPAAADQSDKADESGPGLGTWPDWVIVAFTLALVWVAFLQHGLEAKLARDSEATGQIAKDAASAAKISADTAKRQLDLQRIVQRGRLNVSNMIATLQKQPVGHPVFGVAIVIKNSGNSAIKIESVVSKSRIDTFLAAEPSPLADPAHQLGWPLSPGGEAIVNATEMVWPFDYDATIKDLVSKRTALWVYGAAVYQDEIAGRQVHRFCHRFDFHANPTHGLGPNVSVGWTHAGGPAYWGEEKIEADA